MHYGYGNYREKLRIYVVGRATFLLHVRKALGVNLGVYISCPV